MIETQRIPQSSPRAPLGAWLHSERAKWAAYGYADAQAWADPQPEACIPPLMVEAYRGGYAAGMEAIER